MVYCKPAVYFITNVTGRSRERAELARRLLGRVRSLDTSTLKINPLTWLDPVQKWLAWKGCRRPKVPMTSAISLVASRLSMSSLPDCFWFMHMPSRREMTLEPTLRPAQGGTVTIRNLSCWNAKVLLYIFFTNLVLHDLCSGLCDKTWQYVANICKSLFRIMDIDPVTLSSAAHIFLAKVVSACWVSAPSLLIKAGTVSKQERLKLTPTEAFNLLYFSIFQSRICLAKVTCPALRTAPNSSMLKKSAFSLQ